MRPFLLCFAFLGIVDTANLYSQSLIVDHHAVAAFDSIPETYKTAAENLRMLFMDRSVGGNISFYLDCLSNPWATAPSACKRYMHMDSMYAVDPEEVFWNNTWDRSQWRYEYWPTGCSEDVTCFIDFMSIRLDSFDVLGCQFSYLSVLPGSNIADPVNGFFGSEGGANKASTYAAYATAHPDKKIIWWTTSLARGIGTTESESFNDQMRNYANQHDIILFDVADILAHDPDGFPCYDNRDGVTYKDESNPDDGLALPAICPQYTTETEGGHLGSISAGGVRVAKAFWVLMARIAGWDGITTSTQSIKGSSFQFFPNPATDEITIEFSADNVPDEYILYSLDGKVQMQARIKRETITNRKFQISLEGIIPGIYIFQFRSKTESAVQKIFIY